MATRFYLSSTATVPTSLAPSYAAWTRTSEGTRRAMQTTKDSSAMTSRTGFANTSPAANASALIVQYSSAPLAAGTVFTASTHTISGVIRAMESAANNNVNRMPICLKVVSVDGATTRATLLALGHQGPNTTEWATSLSSKTLANAIALTGSYTTVIGDRLVIEIGGQVDATGGTSVTASLSTGSASATDLAANTEGVTTANNPWIELSNTFSTTPEGSWGTSSRALAFGGSAAGSGT